MIAEPKYSTIIAFIESLCEVHADILHAPGSKRFFKSLEDFTGNEKAGNVVLFQPMPGGFDGETTDAAFETFRFALWHLTSYERDNDAENQTRIQAMGDIARQFMARIYSQPKEFDPDDDDNTTNFFDFTIGNVITDIIPPTVADGWLGYRYEYVMRYPAIIEVDNSKWTDI